MVVNTPLMKHSAYTTPTRELFQKSMHTSFTILLHVFLRQLVGHLWILDYLEWHSQQIIVKLS